MNNKIVCQLDNQGYFVGTLFALPSPEEPGVFLLPGDCVDAPAPEMREGFKIRWNGTWVYEEIPPPPVPEPVYVPTVAEVSRDMRNRLLMQTDWTQLSDAPLTDTQKKAWADYRQLLRDLANLS